jgi:hypothetical protein
MLTATKSRAPTVELQTKQFATRELTKREVFV